MTSNASITTYLDTLQVFRDAADTLRRMGELTAVSPRQNGLLVNPAPHVPVLSQRIHRRARVTSSGHVTIVQRCRQGVELRADFQVLPRSIARR